MGLRRLRVFGLAALMLCACGRAYQPGDFGFFEPPRSGVQGWLVPETLDGKLMSPENVFNLFGEVGPLFTEADIEADEVYRRAEENGNTTLTGERAKPGLRVYFKQSSWERIRADSTKITRRVKAALAMYRGKEVVGQATVLEPLDAQAAFGSENDRIGFLMKGLVRRDPIDEKEFRFRRIEWLKEFVRGHPDDLRALKHLAWALDRDGQDVLALDAFEELCRLAPVSDRAESSLASPPIVKLEGLETLAKLYAKRGEFERGIKFLRGIYLEAAEEAEGGKIPAIDAFRLRSSVRRAILLLYLTAGERDHAMKLLGTFSGEMREEISRWTIPDPAAALELAELELLLPRMR